MSHRHLFVADPLDVMNIWQDSTFGLMLECQSRGHEIYHCGTEGLLGRSQAPSVRCRAVQVRAEQGNHFTLGELRGLSLDAFDVIWMRKDPPFDLNYIAATYVLDFAPASTRVINRPDSLRSWNEKAIVLRFAQWCPAGLLSRDIAAIKEFQRDVGGSVVIKPLQHSGGNGVVALHPGDLNTNALLEMSTRQGQDFVLVQQYQPEVVEGDKRVILINGEIGGALLRVPPADDLRGNIHVGARTERCELTPQERRVCEALRQPLLDAGHLFVGIDLIGEKLTEINVTSPTGIREILMEGGPDLAASLVDAALA
ncbi:MAG TPA: glutathione synthase [Myxococcales bacterium]|nr:glutathione synthase [Myxococcales bacterium]HAN30406.1 glutathione synthase [Myxococcales bacterium]